MVKDLILHLGNLLPNKIVKRKELSIHFLEKRIMY